MANGFINSIWWHFLLRMGWNRALSMRVSTLLYWNSCNSFGNDVMQINLLMTKALSWCTNLCWLSDTCRVSKLTRLGGPGLGVRDVLTPTSLQTQENGKKKSFMKYVILLLGASSVFCSFDKVPSFSDLHPVDGEEVEAEIISSTISVPAPSSSSVITKWRRKKFEN